MNKKTPFETFEFLSREDKVRLKGIFLPHPAAQAIILLCHGRGGDKISFLKRMFFLFKAGYSLMSFDFRNHGESQKKEPFSYGFYEKLDVLGALDYLKNNSKLGPDKFGGLGFSLGAAALIFAAAQEKIFKAIVCESGYSSLEKVALVENYGPDNATIRPDHPRHQQVVAEIKKNLGLNFKIAPIKAIGKISPAAIFIIAGETEKKDAELLFETSKEPKQIWVVKGASHANCYEAAGLKYEEKILEFFNQTLP